MKNKFKILTIVAGIFNFIILLNCYAITNEELQKSFINIYPDKKMEIDTLNFYKLTQLISDHINRDANLSKNKLQNESLDYEIKSLEASFLPQLQFLSDFNTYSTYYRQVIVNAYIPVHWDNENPVITNITLPNGGEGIIWLPRPDGYAWKDIPLNASIDYNNKLSNSSLGLMYKTPFGLEINALNMTLDYRLNPKTYGMPWSSTLNNSIKMPLFKNFGYMGSPLNVQVEIDKINNQINDKTYEIQKNYLVSNLFTTYFELIVTYKKINIIDSLQKLLKIQIDDVDILTSEQRVTISENIKIKSAYRSVSYQKEYMLNRFIYLCSKLNIENVSAETVMVFIPSWFEFDSFIEASEALYRKTVTKENIENIINDHPEVLIRKMSQEQSNINIEYAENQKKPEINFLASFGSFEVNNLGYSNFGSALVKTFTKPDGITWNLGVQYILPTGSSDEYRYLSAVKQEESTIEDMKGTKKSLSDILKQHIYGIENALDGINNSKNNLSVIDEIINKEATPLFIAKRLNRYDYSSYLSEHQNAELNLITAKGDYFNLFFSFTQDMNINLDEFLIDRE